MRKQSKKAPLQNDYEIEYNKLLLWLGSNYPDIMEEYEEYNMERTYYV